MRFSERMSPAAYRFLVARGSRWSVWALALAWCCSGVRPTVALQAQEVTNVTSDSKSSSLPSNVSSDVSNADTQFLRLSKTDSGVAKSLDVAVTTYRSKDPGGISVDLIGAVHIGQRHYYERLNALFDQYDVLLYELVAPEGTVIPRGGKREGTNPVAMLQETAKSMLGLESQLELIDYNKPHFVRADMTPQQMASKMQERGETAMTIALSTLADMMRQQNLAARDGQKTAAREIEETGLFELLGDPQKMKRVMAEQFVATGSLDQSLGGALNQLLVIDRNAEALRGLQKQIAAGKKKIGIFYGAAHMPDFEKRLVGDFGLQRSAQTWIAAWDLQTSPSNKPAEPAGLLFNLLKAIGE